MKLKENLSSFLLNSPLKNSDIDLTRSKGEEKRDMLSDLETGEAIKKSLRSRKFSDSAELLREDRKR